MSLFRICTTASVLLAAARAACAPRDDGSCAPADGETWAALREDGWQDREHSMEMLQVQSMHRAQGRDGNDHPSDPDEECAGLDYNVDHDGVVHFKFDVKVIDPSRVFFFAELDFVDTKMRVYAWAQRGEDRMPFSFVVDFDYYPLAKNYVYAADYFEVAKGSSYMVEVMKNATTLCIKAHVPESVNECNPLPPAVPALATLPKAGAYQITLPRNPAYEVDCGRYRQLPGDDLLQHHNFPGHYPKGSQGNPVFRRFDPKKVPHRTLEARADGYFHFKVVARVEEVNQPHGIYVPFLLVNFARVGVDLYFSPARGYGMVPGGIEVEMDAWDLHELPIYGDSYFPVQKGATYHIEVTKNCTHLCVFANVTGANNDSQCADVPKPAEHEPAEGRYKVWFPRHRGTSVLHFQNV